MDINDLITKLNIMKKEKPDEFKDFTNRLKIEKPDIYEKVSRVIKVEEETPISFGEEPLDLRMAEERSKKYTINLFIIIIIIIIAFLVGIYLFSQ